MARAIPRPQPERRGKREQLGALLSLVCFYPRPALCLLFAKIFLARHGDLLAATTNSNAARLSKLPTNPSLHHNTFYTLQKRVRSLLASFSGLSLLVYFEGAVTALLTNPIWVVKVRTFTAPSNSPAAHRGLFSAHHTCLRPEVELIFLLRKLECSRRIRCDLSRRGPTRALPRHDARAGRREQWGAAVYDV